MIPKLELYTSIQNLVVTKTPFVLVTLVDVVLSAPQEVGAKMIVTRNGLLSGTVGGGKLEAAALNKALELLAANHTSCQKQALNALVRWNLKKDLGMTCGGEATLFFDVHAFSHWNIAVFGAGHVSQALIPILLTLDCQLSVIDDREEWLEKLPKNIKLNKILASPLSSYVKELSEKTYIISITQGHSHDLPVIDEVFQRMDPPYIGVIGSPTKALVLKRELRSRGHDEAKIASIFCPIGLKFGGRDPHEIALSIAAQLLSIRDQKKDNLQL